jgi:pyridoxal phosphate enzyme (YggS family)
MDFPGLPERLAMVRDRIGHHQARGGWTHPVRIVAVTKTHGPGAVQAAVAAGIPDVGENRVQEALAKQALCAGIPATWHLIGSLQRNKARLTVGRFALIHSVDRLELAQELDRRQVPGRPQPILVEVNCSGESQKGGCDPGDLPVLLDAIRSLAGLELRGLMTMAALTGDEAVQRAAFGRLRELRDRLRSAGHPVHELSMGMSGDYGVAVEEGATMIRLGTLLFGERSP